MTSALKARDVSVAKSETKLRQQGWNLHLGSRGSADHPLASFFPY